MTNLDKLERLIYETIDNEITDFIHSDETQAVMYGYYSAIVELVKESVKKYGRLDTTRHLCQVYPTFCHHDVDENICDSAPLLLLRDHLEDYCRDHLLPEQDSAYYSAIEIALDCVDWCDLAESMEQDFCDPNNC